MPNTNPQAIRLLGERIRPLCDRIGQTHFSVDVLLELLDTLNAKELYPGDAEPILDKAETDGRPIVTNAMALELLTTGLQTIQQFFVTEKALLDLVLQIAVNPDRL